jgi:hypothetical protein
MAAARRNGIAAIPIKALVLALACLSSADTMAWEKSSAYTSAPLLSGQPGTIETKTQLFADTTAKRLKGEAWLQHMSWDELTDVARGW